MQNKIYFFLNNKKCVKAARGVRPNTKPRVLNSSPTGIVFSSIPDTGYAIIVVKKYY